MDHDFDDNLKNMILESRYEGKLTKTGKKVKEKRKTTKQL